MESKEITESKEINKIKEVLKGTVLKVATVNLIYQESTETFKIINNAFLLIDLLPNEALELLFEELLFKNKSNISRARIGERVVLEFSWSEGVFNEDDYIPVDLYVSADGFEGAYVHEYGWQNRKLSLEEISPNEKSSIKWHEGLLAWWGLYKFNNNE